MIDNTHVVVLRGTGREMIPVPEMEAFAERFGFRFVAHERGDANRSARVETTVLLHRKQLSGRTHVRQLGGSESTGAPVVRQGQLDLQETYPRGAARTIRRGATASQTAAGVDSGSVSTASTHGGRGRLRLGELHSLLGAGRLDRAAGGGARDQGQDRDRTRCAPHRHACARGDAAAATHHAAPSTNRRAGKASSAAIRTRRKRRLSQAAPEIAAMWRR